MRTYNHTILNFGLAFPSHRNTPRIEHVKGSLHVLLETAIHSSLGHAHDDDDDDDDDD